ncbi:SET domain-containing protein-lysine N-methyltransferase [Sphingomonas sp. BT-65]|uniref:SET domain-containing protein-lysine N-methyltransferase n=1 Tax=Sphingomonas sp. BT-65 TaxID=2989821 RepID=UPI002235C40C|nr:SET domain-containing protein [Sphingomonas sp. BT-65]MCW4460195.1 SET domain-containing protein-lysine N-methyltransferase [Sphingomonas sp. BT-65]
MTTDFWFVLAMGFSFAAYAIYLLGMRREIVQPNRASWLIWSASAAIEALTYHAVNPGSPQGWVFLLSATCCIVVTIALWRRSNWAPPTNVESACMATCLVALIIWVAFREAFWAHMLVVAAVPVSFWPTWASVWKDRSHERSPAWGLWTMGDLATLLVAARAGGTGFDEFAYIFVELACHASIWFIIGLATINPLRSLGWKRGGFLILDRYRPARNLFAVGENHLGKAVYATCRFAEGAELMRFTGRRFHVTEVPSLMRGSDDRFVQVTPDHYMGPSGQLDDLVNHSCDPNAGLRFTEDGVILVALRPIAAGDEISWDYSTTLAQSNWHMICQCRSDACRRVIGNFDTLDPDRQEFFRARNLVAPYLRRKDDVAPSARARWRSSVA